MSASTGFRECVGCGAVWDDREPSAVREHHYPFCPLEEGRSFGGPRVTHEELKASLCEAVANAIAEDERLRCDNCGQPVRVRGLAEPEYVHDHGLVHCLWTVATVDGSRTPLLSERLNQGARRCCCGHIFAAHGPNGRGRCDRCVGGSCSRFTEKEKADG